MDEQEDLGPMVLSQVEIVALLMACQFQLASWQKALTQFRRLSPQHDAISELSVHLASAARRIEAAGKRREFPAIA